MPDRMDDMTPTPEDIIEFELLHAEGHLPKAATPGRLVKALTDAGRVIEQDWIPIDEVPPPRHRNVWCLNRDGWQFEGRICCGMHKPFMTYPRGDGNASNTAPAWIDVTHWRPLPNTPRAMTTDTGS